MRGACRGARVPFFGFLAKSGSRIPDRTGKCVILEFGDSVSFIGMSVNVGFDTGSPPPPSTGKCVILEFGPRSPFIGVWINPGYKIPAIPGECVSLEFGGRAPFLVFDKVGI